VISGGLISIGMILIGIAPEASAQEPSFALGFNAPANAPPAAGGTTTTYIATGTLTTTGLAPTDVGAQGWSLSMSADGGGKVIDVTTAGTIVDTLFAGGFNKTEVTSGAGNEGAVSAVVLAFTLPVTLPPSGVVDIVKLTVEVPVKEPRDLDGDEEVDCDPTLSRVFYVDGRKGSGQPVETKITYKGQSVLPSRGDATTRVCPVLPPRALSFRVDVVGGQATGDEQGGRTPWSVETAPNSGLVDVVAGVHLVAHLPDDPDPLVQDGPQGWSISVTTDPCFNVADTTTAGSKVDELFAGGFNKTEVIDPAKNSGQQGVVSAIVLSFTLPRSLAPESDSLILKIAGKIDAAGLSSPGQCTPACNVDVVSPDAAGLRGSGQPVQTAVTVAGETKKPGVVGAAISVCQIAQISFIRGNANDDSKVDIGDAIFIINFLFKSGPAAACLDALDSNDDGQVNVDDAGYLINYSFLGSLLPPPPPFPACGADPTDDTTACTESSPSC
jgi:hypothetical protein